MEASTVVIKVKYGDMLRRFNTWIAADALNLNMDGLREKILSLFNFTPNTELMLTYIDEDGDEVTLVDDDDLRDVVKQVLNPLRITVKLNTEKNGRHFLLSGSSTPLRSPRVQQPLQYLNSGVSEILKTAPEPLRETLVKHSTELTSNLSSSAPGINELVDYFSKLGLSYLAHCLDSQPKMQIPIQSDVPQRSTAATETTDLELSKVDSAKVPLNGGSEERPVKRNESLEKLKPGATLENNEVKFGNITEVTIEASSSTAPGFNAVARDLQTISVGQTGNDSLQNSAPIHAKSMVVTNTVGKKEKSKKEKVKKIDECYPKEKFLVTSSHLPPVANKDWFVGKFGVSSNVPSVKAVNKPSRSLGSNLVSVGSPDLMKVDYLDGRTKSVFSGGFQNTSGSIWAPNPSSLKFPGSFSSPSPTYECPFSGLHAENVSASPPHPASKAVTFSKSSSLNVDSFDVFHCGVRCDGCGVHPITGPRFKSKVKVDYDLCMICFAEMGNASDYIRMDRPVVYQHHVLYDSHARDQGPPSQQDCSGFKVKSCPSKLDSCFVHDVNVIDGTVMAPLIPFTKIWRMRNNGTVVWPQKTQLVWIGGDKLSNATSVELNIPATGSAIDQELDVSVDFIAPELPGRYVSYWRMASPSGQKFGQRIWILIQVDASVKVTPRKRFWDLNLNLPPVSSSLTGPETINVVPEPMVEDSHPEPDNSQKAVELVESVVPLQQNNEQEMKFPINDSLLVGSGASSSLPSFPPFPTNELFVALPSISPAVLCPLPLFDASAQTLASGHKLPDAIAQALASGHKLSRKEELEEKLLKELEDRGFKDADLNKEMLRMNEYDLEQVVDDLWGVSDWDPLLEELKVMGFYDTEMNKKLLRKNDGSLKRVVMDLIAAEKM